MAVSGYSKQYCTGRYLGAEEYLLRTRGTPALRRNVRLRLLQLNQVKEGKLSASSDDVWIVDAGGSCQRMKPGLRVKAAWHDGEYYPSTVEQVSMTGKHCSVVFHDGDRREDVGIEELKLRWHTAWTRNYMACFLRKNGSHYASGKGLDRFITSYEV